MPDAALGTCASHGGTVRLAPPRTAGIWVAQVAGTGIQALRWTAERDGIGALLQRKNHDRTAVLPLALSPRS